MTTIENRPQLRKAFLKIGWAPLVTIIGSFAVCLIYAILTASHIDPNSPELIDPHYIIADCKLLVLMSAVVSFIGYLITFCGFAQAHKQLGLSRPGKAFSTLKIIFLIFLIISVLLMVVMLFIPTTPTAYENAANNIQADTNFFSALGIGMVIAYVMLVVYSIVALFVINSRTKTIAETTNIARIHRAATGTKLFIWCFFCAIVVGIVTALIEEPIIDIVLSLALLVLAVIALVKWISGWLGAASEVRQHPVQVLDADETAFPE